MNKSSDGYGKVDRKTKEKMRRIQMKGLCDNLASIVQQPSKLYTQTDLYDNSIDYILQLTNKISQLTEKRDETSRLLNDNSDNFKGNHTVTGSDGVILPILKIKETDDGLQVNLISRLKRNFTFCEVIRIIEEGGAEVLNAGYTTIDQKVYYTLHAQARISRVGIEITSIHERLQELVYRNL